MKNRKRTKKYLGTRIQKKLLLLVFASAAIPMTVVAISLYYLIFNMLAWQLVIPEAIAFNLMPVLRKVNLLLLISIPLILLIVWIIALELSHRLAGPVYRIERELEEISEGKKSGPLKLRRKDELKPLVDKINKIICK